MKSARTRGGIIEDVDVRGMRLRDVGRVLCFDFDWYCAYNQCRIPEGYTEPVPPHWRALLAPVPEGQGLPVARNVRIQNVQAEHCEEAMYIRGLEESPFEDFTFEDFLVYPMFGPLSSSVRNSFVDQDEERCDQNELAIT